MYRHILVATDGSKLSDKAVSAAIEMANRFGAKLTAFHAMEEYPIGMFSEYAMLSGAATPQQWEAGERKRAQRILDKVHARALKAGVICASATRTAAEPYKAIVEAARKSRCDLIVMASHGRRGVQGLILGSETHKVLTHGKVPVLVCR